MTSLGSFEEHFTNGASPSMRDCEVEWGAALVVALVVGVDAEEEAYGVVFVLGDGHVESCVASDVFGAGGGTGLDQSKQSKVVTVVRCQMNQS